MKPVLALDLGTKCGHVFGCPAARIDGVWDLKGGRYEGGGMRFLRFRRNLDELHAARPIGEVVYEEVRRHLGTDAAHVYGGLLGQLTAWCEEHGVPYEGVPVGTIKRWAVGKGNATKDQMIAAMVALGEQPKDDNHADALALWRLRMDQIAQRGPAGAASAVSPKRKVA
mgnify:FL=1